MAILEPNDILFAQKTLLLMPWLSGSAKTIGGAILDHFNKKNGLCDPGIKRLARMLGFNRSTVIRATDELAEAGLFEKIVHGGRGHRNSYKPNFEAFRAFVANWDQKMKTGEKAMRTAKIARKQRQLKSNYIKSQICNFDGRKNATQTLRINPSNKTSRREVSGEKLASATPEPFRNDNGLGNHGANPHAQHTMSIPIAGSTFSSRVSACRAAAERRIHDCLLNDRKLYQRIVPLITKELYKEAISAEVEQSGAGVSLILLRLGLHAHSTEKVRGGQ